jgi:hypothetical protein
MASIKPEVASPATTMLDTGLNSLASGSAAVSGTAFDNSPGTNGYLWADFELVIAAQGSNRSASPYLEVYIEPAPDGTNHATDANLDAYTFSFNPSASALAAQRLTVTGVPIPACKFHVRLKNVTGQALANSGNTVKIFPTRLQTA